MTWLIQGNIAAYRAENVKLRADIEKLGVTLAETSMAHERRVADLLGSNNELLVLWRTAKEMVEKRDREIARRIAIAKMAADLLSGT